MYKTTATPKTINPGPDNGFKVGKTEKVTKIGCWVGRRSGMLFYVGKKKCVERRCSQLNGGDWDLVRVKIS